MSEKPYDDILRRAKHELSADEQLKLIDELCRQAGAKNGPHYIRELKGLGKHLWVGADPDEYVRKERDSWSG